MNALFLAAVLMTADAAPRHVTVEPLGIDNFSMGFTGGSFDVKWLRCGTDGYQFDSRNWNTKSWSQTKSSAVELRSMTKQSFAVANQKSSRFM